MQALHRRQCAAVAGQQWCSAAATASGVARTQRAKRQCGAAAPGRWPCSTAAEGRCGRGGATVARGILDSYRREQAARQGGASSGVDTIDTLGSGSGSGSAASSGSDSEADGAPVVQSLLMDGVTFTEDDTPCPTDCVLEVFTEADLDGVFASAVPEALVVVDFFKDDCSACRYMAVPFHRMCRAASEHAQHVIFLKHNVYDQEHELTPLARRLKVKSVPLFSLYKAGQLVESFATRDKARLAAAVEQHAPVAVPQWKDE